LTMNMLATVEPRATAPRNADSAPTHGGVDLRVAAAMGTLAMSIVHDLRNPLATIHSGAEILNDPQLPERQVRRVAGNIHSASVRIQSLLQDYVELCRTKGTQRHPVNLRSLVADAVNAARPVAAAQSVVVEQHVRADLVVTLDYSRIRSVLANLLANALEAMPAGGSIQINTAVTETSVVIRVLDTGPGIAPEIRDRLFQPFVTARKPGGWGLGLVQARQAVIDHGGDMWLEPPAGRGACFGFSLPAFSGGCQ
jgi:signal transduction histidine kinase